MLFERAARHVVPWFRTCGASAGRCVLKQQSLAVKKKRAGRCDLPQAGGTASTGWTSHDGLASRSPKSTCAALQTLLGQVAMLTAGMLDNWYNGCGITKRAFTIKVLKAFFTHVCSFQCFNGWWRQMSYGAYVQENCVNLMFPPGFVKLLKTNAWCFYGYGPMGCWRWWNLKKDRA